MNTRGLIILIVLVLMCVACASQTYSIKDGEVDDMGLTPIPTATAATKAKIRPADQDVSKLNIPSKKVGKS